MEESSHTAKCAASSPVGRVRIDHIIGKFIAEKPKAAAKKFHSPEAGQVIATCRDRVYVYWRPEYQRPNQQLEWNLNQARFRTS
jgi:hypothetical protein